MPILPDPRSRLVGVVLAGGRSRRMGVEKATLRFEGSSLLERACGALLAVVDEVVVSARAGAPLNLPDGVDRLDDALPDSGPAAAVHHAVMTLGRPVVVVAVDMPMLDSVLVRWLIAQSGDGERAGMATSGGRAHPTLAVYTPESVGRSERSPQGARFTDWARRIGLNEWPLPDDLTQLAANVNTRDELARAVEASARAAQAPDAALIHCDTHVEVTWDHRLCIHHGACGAAAGSGGPPRDAFGGLAPGEVVEAVARCPSGALYARRLDGEREEAPGENTVELVAGGPALVRGDLEFERYVPRGMPGVRHHAALCRCGSSQNKPFCDGSHRELDLEHDISDAPRGSPLIERGGKLTIRVRVDGPFKLMGNMTIVARDRVVWTGDECALCRCGASSRKPFCDGSHRYNGFATTPGDDTKV